MKKTILLLLFVLAFKAPCSAQGMPVYDNTNFVSLVKSLVESAKQTTQLVKTVKFLKDQKENIEKVNAVIKQLRAVKELTKNNKMLVQLIRSDLKNILQSKYIKPGEITRISDSFNAIISVSLEDLNFINQILSSNHLKMTDGERAKILKEKEQQSKELLALAQQKTKRYQDIIAFRELQDKLNNRKTKF